MAREGRSHVRKRKKGCLVGCLTNLMLLLGVIALVFVGAHVLGFVESDPQTGAPTLKLDHLPEIRLGDFDLSQIQPPDLSGMTEKLPKWAYGVNANGLTVKTLRAGDGEAVFVCADGYTMLLGAGSGTGASLCGQLLLCGANHLSAAVAMSSEDEQLGAMNARATKPSSIDLGGRAALCYTLPMLSPSSSGLGRRPFKAKIAGSNPAGGTICKKYEPARP